MAKHIGPTDVDSKRIVTYCTPFGACRVTELPGDWFTVEPAGLEPFQISAEGVRALIDAFRLLEFD